MPGTSLVVDYLDGGSFIVLKKFIEEILCEYWDLLAHLTEFWLRLPNGRLALRLKLFVESLSPVNVFWRLDELYALLVRVLLDVVEAILFGIVNCFFECCDLIWMWRLLRLSCGCTR